MAATKQIKTTFSLAYYRCVTPSTLTCIALRPEDATCAGCKEWGEVSIYRVLEGQLDDKEYVRKKAHAGAFVRAILTQIYGVPSDEAGTYVPPTMATLYADPQKYGWLELPNICTGAIVIDKKKAAFIIAESDPRGGARRGAVSFHSIWRNPRALLTLLHPSARHDGHLRESQARHFFTGAHGVPKVIVPKYLLLSSSPGDFVYGHEQRVPPGYDVAADDETQPLSWNTWLQRKRFEPEKRLAPKTTYQLMVHLAPFQYKSTTARSSRGSATTSIETAARLTQSTVRLRILPLTNDSYIRALTKSPVNLTVDVKRYVSWTGFRPTGDELRYLRDGGEPNFVFGAASIAVQTTELEGRTTIELSVWDDNGWPVDEISIPVCIGTDRACTPAPGPPAFAGIDLQRDARPTAALHVIGLDGSVAGIFHRNDIDDAPFHIWKLAKTADELQGNIAGVLRDFSAPNADFARHGERLYNLLFGKSDDDGAHAARHAFEAFAVPRTATATGDASLYVRFLAAETRHGRILPLGAAKLPGRDDAYLGFLFHIETPLPRQPNASAACIGNWSAVIPSNTSPRLAPLRTRLNARIAPWLNRAIVFEKMSKFREWITKGTTLSPAGILIVSHHEDGKLTLDAGDFLGADEVQRTFPAPALAILNACGTATGETGSFVTAFNESGVDAIIATKHPVPVDMAADFVQCFDNALPTIGAASVSTTYFRAIQCLRKKTGEDGKPYGPAALAYTLLGDGNLNLCAPPPAAIARMEQNAHR